MKKALLLVCILSVSVVTTACINNLAVQELNNKAAAYMEKGNYEEAIDRLKSSVDLDDSLYETHYNLGVAYAKNNEYANALNSYKKVIELKPDFADVYYSLAVAEEDIITDIYSGNLIVDKDGTLSKPQKSENSDADDDNTPHTDDYKLSEHAESYVNGLTSDAVKNYETYLEKGKEINDHAEVQARIQDLKSRLADKHTENIQGE